MYEDLVHIIGDYLAKQPVAVVVITGHGGSGKSTLADRLARQFDIADDQIIRGDNLYAKDFERRKASSTHT